MSLHKALQVSKDSNVRDGYHVYKTNVSEAWSIGGIPHGGYAVGIILSAAGALQSSTPHPDPVHLTAHYLEPVDIQECEVRIKVTKSGRTFTNMDADLVQNGKTKIITRLIYGVLPDLSQMSSSPSDNLTLTPSSPYGRTIPLSQHPSLMTPDQPSTMYLNQAKAEDRYFDEQNAKRAKRRASGNDQVTTDCGMEWGMWSELKDPEDKLQIEMLPFFADCMKNIPSLLPKELRPGPSWFATVVLTVEFKSRIPSSILFPQVSDPTADALVSGPFSPRTVGVYSSSRFMTEGRHDEFVEVWTSPSSIGTSHSSSNDPNASRSRTNASTSKGEVEIDPRWREKQVCLAISTQMALTIPEENSRRGRSRL